MSSIQTETIDVKLVDACRSGNIKNATLAISQGANNIEEGFFEACQYNQIETAKLMVSRGANNFHKIFQDNQRRLSLKINVFNLFCM